MKNEPVMTLIVALIIAGAALLVSFGVKLSDVQVLALVNFAQAAIALGVYVRSRVTPTAKIAA